MVGNKLIKLTSILYFFLIISPIALSDNIIVTPIVPFLVGQQILINGEPAANLSVSIHNLNTSDKTTIKTNDKGEYIVNLARFPKGYSLGDIIRVTICRAKNDCRSFKFPISGKGGLAFKIDIIWEDKKYKIPENTTFSPELIADFLEEQDKNFIEILERERNLSEIKANERIKTERRISIGIVSTFFLFSALVTWYFSRKYGHKPKDSSKNKKN